MQRLHAQLLSASVVPEAHLSMPTHVTTLPFLCLDEHIPERMKAQKRDDVCYQTFSFMGRSRMEQLLSTIRSLSNRTLSLRAAGQRKTAAAVATAAAAAASAMPAASAASSSLSRFEPGESIFAELLVYGTPGWGKSYMMAAAAVVLRQEFFTGKSVKRVVYLPDCGQLRGKPVVYMKNALLLAFADHPSSLQRIHACRTVEELVAFCDNVPKAECFLLFLADQTNKLTAKLHGDSVEKQQEKMVASRLLRHCSYQHFLVEAISINDSNKEEVQQKQENRKEMPMFGELEEVSALTHRAQHRRHAVHALLTTRAVFCDSNGHRLSGPLGSPSTRASCLCPQTGRQRTSVSPRSLSRPAATCCSCRRSSVQHP